MSLDEIAVQFGIKSRNRAAVTQNLRRRLKKLHPDATGGSFANESQKSEYEKVTAALSALSNKSALTVVPAQITDIVAALEKNSELILAQSEIISQRNSREILESLEKSALTTINKSVSARYLAPKIGAAFFGAVGVFLTATSGSMQQIYEQLFYSQTAATSASQLISGAFILAGATMTLLAYVLEEREKVRKRHMLSEIVFQNFLASGEFARILKHDGDADGVWPSIFSENDLAFALDDYSSVDTYLAEELASVFFERLVARNVARRVSKPSLSPVLALDESIAEEIGLREYRARKASES